MRKILITGSRGFIGSHLKTELIRRNYSPIEINTPEGNILDKNTLYKYSGDDICYVFHLAGKTFVPESWSEPLEFYETNTMGTANVLEFCRTRNVPITYVSAYLYGQPSKLPITESDSLVPNNPYAHSKYLAEQLCAFYAKEFNVAIKILRPFNIYGIGQNEKFLVPYLIKQALYEDVIRVKDLLPKRDYVYIDDVIEALVLTISHQPPFAIFNIGSGISFSAQEVIDTIQGILGTEKRVVSENAARRNELNNVVADISRARKELQWIPKHSLREGLARIIRYEKENMAHKRKVVC